MTKKTKKTIEPISIRSVTDIRNAIAPFIKNVKQDKVEVKGDISWTEEDQSGNKVTHTVTASAVNEDVSLKELLIAEFTKVKNKKETWDKIQSALAEDAYSATLPIANIDDMYMSVDNIVRHRLAGKREGLTVVWRLGDKKFVFDPFTSELREENAQPK